MDGRLRAAVAAATIAVAAMAAGGAFGQRHGHGFGPGYRYGYRWGYGGPRWRGYDGPWFGGPWFWGGVPPPYYYDYPPYGPPPAYYLYPPPAVYHYRPRPRPPPAPAPAPAPAPERQLERFVVYFPFDRDDLTPAARGVIRAAAAYEARNGGGHVIIVGHTDTSGSEGYNQPLSERRARVVRGALVAEGVDAGAVQMDWRGEHDLAVETGEGVKEALNRRTTILIQPAG